jgi:hypothetical protein
LKALKDNLEDNLSNCSAHAISSDFKRFIGDEIKTFLKLYKDTLIYFSYRIPKAYLKDSFEDLNEEAFTLKLDHPIRWGYLYRALNSLCKAANAVNKALNEIAADRKMKQSSIPSLL